MKAALVRRFTNVEVVYHAIQLILYLILFFSGGALLLQRIFETEKINFSTLSNIHRLTGILLIAFITQTIVISVFSTSFRSLWQTLLEAFKWNFRDMVWLIKIMLHTFVPKVTIPPSGRFNPGQKLHLLAIFIVLFVFSSTGLIMILIPGALGAWIAHAVCFIPALLFLGIHLFLSLVNPATNKALKGIMTGYVPLYYAQRHHSLWQNSEEPITHTNHVSLLAIILTTFGLAAVVGSGAWYIGFDQVKSQISKVASNNGREVILPGMLVSAHTEVPDTKYCTSCHNYLNAPPSAKCLKCHEEIQTVIDNHRGYHGTLNGQCRTCHAEHNGLTADISSLDTKAFNHENARYSLIGKHRDLDCAKCHQMEDKKTKRVKIKYTGLEFDTCTQCHQNPHTNFRDNNDCLSCHTMRGWSKDQLVFDHNQDSQYKLEGKHIEVSCKKCHLPDVNEKEAASVKFINIGSECGDCHDDPHEGQITHSCKICHQERGWKDRNLLFVHNQHSSYKLDDLHALISCSLCHLSNEDKVIQYKPLPQECSLCHTDIVDFMNGKSPIGNANPDPHAGRVSCIDCHVVDVPKQLPYRYAQKCGLCHNPRYYDLYFDWEKSMGQGMEIIVEITKSLNENNNDNNEKENLANKIEIIRKIGFHNIQMSKKLFEALR